MKTRDLWFVAVAIVVGMVVTIMAFSFHDRTAEDEKRAGCVKLCAPRLVKVFGLDRCECNDPEKPTEDIPGRCEASCLPRLVKGWDKFRGTCDCEPTSTWGHAMKDPSEFRPIDIDGKREVEIIYRRMVEAGAPASAYPPNLPPPHPHTP